MDMQVGFDLRHTRHYSTPEQAKAQVEKALADLIQAGVVFNIIVVEQRKGGPGTDAEDRRHIPLLCCWRVPRTFPGTETTALLFAASKGFTCFA